MVYISAKFWPPGCYQAVFASGLAGSAQSTVMHIEFTKMVWSNSFFVNMLPYIYDLGRHKCEEIIGSVNRPIGS